MFIQYKPCYPSALLHFAVSCIFIIYEGNFNELVRTLYFEQLLN